MRVGVSPFSRTRTALRLFHHRKEYEHELHKQLQPEPARTKRPGGNWQAKRKLHHTGQRGESSGQPGDLYKQQHFQRAKQHQQRKHPAQTSGGHLHGGWQCHPHHQPGLSAFGDHRHVPAGRHLFRIVLHRHLTDAGAVGPRLPGFCRFLWLYGVLCIHPPPDQYVWHHLPVCRVEIKEQMLFYCIKKNPAGGFFFYRFKNDQVLIVIA